MLGKYFVVKPNFQMLNNGVRHHMTSRIKVPNVRSHENELQRGRSAAHFLTLHTDYGLNWRPGGLLAEKAGSKASAPSCHLPWL